MQGLERVLPRNLGHSFCLERLLHKGHDMVVVGSAHQLQVTIDGHKWIGQVLVLDNRQKFSKLGLGFCVGQVYVLYLN